MKKFVIALFMAILPASSIQAQGFGGPQPLNTQTVETSKEAGTVDCHIKIEYPTDVPAAFEESFRSDVLGPIVSCIYSFDAGDTVDVAVPLYDGALADASQELAAQFMTMAREEIEQTKDYAEEAEEYPLHYSMDATVKKEVANPYYATFCVTTYLYTGGAHGMPFTYYITIDRASGKVYTTKDLFPANVLPKLRQIVNRHLTKGEMNDEFGLFDKSEYGGSYPLPGTEAALTAQGVVFQYQAYEIGPYAGGQPTVVVPYAEVYSIMTEKGKKISNFRPKDFQTRAR